MLTVTTPISRLLSSVQLKLADVELKLSQLSLQYTAIDQSVDQLVIPVVEGRDPQVVIDYLEQCRQQADTGGGDDSNKVRAGKLVDLVVYFCLLASSSLMVGSTRPKYRGLLLHLTAKVEHFELHP